MTAARSASGSCGDNGYHARSRRGPKKGRTHSRESGPSAGGAAQGRQQPSGHRKRADAKRAQVPSEEARGHLRNAHHRVLSIAAVQRYLAASSLGNVALRPFLTELCGSLGASMIFDPERLSIEVNVDNSVVDSNASVSFGLIVTELVINALKHAFPSRGQAKSSSLIVLAEESGHYPSQTTGPACPREQTRQSPDFERDRRGAG